MSQQTSRPSSRRPGAALRPGLLAAGLALTAILPLASPRAAEADWLVLQDGSRIETRGAWQARGRQVLFTSGAGVLSAMRLDEVDLDASGAATLAANAPAEAAPQTAPAPPVLVLTNDDIPQYRPAAPLDLGDDDEKIADGGEAPGRCEADGLQITSWKPIRSDEIDGIEIFGTLHNPCDQLMTDLGVRVALHGEDGDTSAEAFLRAPVLAPGSTTSFRALFPGIADVDDEPEFDVEGRTLRFEVAPPEEPTDREDS